MNQHGGGGPRHDSYGTRRGGPYQSHNQRASTNESVGQYWPRYLDGGYFDPDGNLKVDYVSREKVEPLAQKMASLTIHQVRRYFGHCRALETRLRASGATWASIRPQVLKLDIAAADAAAKQPPKIPDLFHDFIKRNVAAIKTEKDFLQGFLPHFEALVGFGQAHFRKDRS